MLRVGDKAPEFETIDELGQPFKLMDHLGKRIVVYFYSNEDTSHSHSFRNSYHVFEDAGIPVVGISGGSRESHRRFKEDNLINFPLLMDEDYTISKMYDAFSLIETEGRREYLIKRITFLIGGDGSIEAIFDEAESMDKSSSRKHANQILEHWGLKL
ncbi:MAG: peroxiredoxin [Candidatus Thorarchaeota archaeon]